MAIYHLSAKVVQRSKGRTATAAAAYRAGEVVACEREGRVHDYSRRRGVAHTEIVGWSGTRAALWNAAEAAEKRKDATTAREYEVALPVELDQGEQVALARSYAAWLHQRHGVAVDVALHDLDGGNPHAHILTTTRPVDAEGTALDGTKAEVEWSDKKRRQHGLEPRKGELEAARAQWERQANAALEAAGTQARIDHRSLAAQQIEREPTLHEGPTVRRIERREQQRAAANSEPYYPATHLGAMNAAGGSVAAAEADLAALYAQRDQEAAEAEQITATAGVAADADADAQDAEAANEPEAEQAQAPEPEADPEPEAEQAPAAAPEPEPEPPPLPGLGGHSMADRLAALYQQPDQEAEPEPDPMEAPPEPEPEAEPEPEPEPGPVQRRGDQRREQMAALALDGARSGSESSRDVVASLTQQAEAARKRAERGESVAAEREAAMPQRLDAKRTAEEIAGGMEVELGRGGRGGTATPAQLAEQRRKREQAAETARERREQAQERAARAQQARRWWWPPSWKRAEAAEAAEEQAKQDESGAYQRAESAQRMEQSAWRVVTNGDRWDRAQEQAAERVAARDAEREPWLAEIADRRADAQAYRELAQDMEHRADLIERGHDPALIAGMDAGEAAATNEQEAEAERQKQERLRREREAEREQQRQARPRSGKSDDLGM